MRESQVVEFKSSWRDEYLRWISGFANAQGGRLVIGKNDDGRVVGVADIDRLLVDIPNKVVSLLGIVVGVNRKGRPGKEYLEIVVKPHPNPVSYKGEYHVRSGSTNQQLKGAALDRFLLQKQGLRWDSVPVPGVSIRMLDARSVRTFRQEARHSKRLPTQVLGVSTAELLEKLQLTVGRARHAQLKRAAILLFHAEPERFCTGAYVKVGFFHGEGGLLYHDEIHGSLFSQVNGTMDILLTKYLRAMVSFRGIQRVETFPVPSEALREAVINAVAHKDYTGGAPIQIRVYEDMIRISNSAHLPDGWTAETLLAPHRSDPPNPDIANTFFRAGMIESWGGGIEMMGRLCVAHGIQAPQVFFDGSGLRLEFHHPVQVAAVAGGTPVAAPVETPQKTLRKTPLKTPDRVLALLAGQPTLTLAEAAAHVGRSPSAVARAVAKLVAAGRLRRVGSDKGGHWEVLR